MRGEGEWGSGKGLREREVWVGAGGLEALSDDASGEKREARQGARSWGI